MLNSVTNNRINTLAFKGYNAQVQNEVQSEQITNTTNNEIKNDFPMDKASAEAFKNYNLINRTTNITEPISADNYKDKLTAAGMKEGKDFRIIDFGTSYTIEILDNGKVKQAVKWFDGTDKNNFAGLEFFHHYPENNDKIVERSLRYDENLNARELSDTFVNPSQDTISKLIPSEININTSAQDYIKNLDQKNIKYKVSTHSNTYISEFDDNGKEVKYTTFSEDDDNKRNIWQIDYKAGTDFQIGNLYTENNDVKLKISGRFK